MLCFGPLLCDGARFLFLSFSSWIQNKRENVYKVIPFYCSPPSLVNTSRSWESRIMLMAIERERIRPPSRKKLTAGRGGPVQKKKHFTFFLNRWVSLPLLAHVWGFHHKKDFALLGVLASSPILHPESHRFDEGVGSLRGTSHPTKKQKKRGDEKKNRS